MGLEKVIFSAKLNEQLEALVFILFKEDYFSFINNAIEYVNKIYDFVYNDILTFPHKKTPKQLKHLGSNYIFYKSNSRTTWYIFFEKFNNNYLITGVLNNHCEEAKFI